MVDNKTMKELNIEEVIAGKRRGDETVLLHRLNRLDISSWGCDSKCFLSIEASGLDAGLDARVSVQAMGSLCDAVLRFSVEST